MIKNALAVIGFITILMFVAGMLGIGNAYFYYGAQKIKCERI